jgi:hypothetical protein
VNGTQWSDRRIVLWMGAIILLLIAAVSVLAPATESDDLQPTTSNTGPQGAKAALLTLQAIGRTTARLDGPIRELGTLDAPHTTLVLAAPVYNATDHDAIADAVKQFLERGGRVLTTGPTGALLLPGGKVGPPTVFFTAVCHTNPVSGPLAAAGRVEMVDSGSWEGETSDGKKTVEVAHRCGEDAVVVRMPVGRGEAVWWSSASPLTNGELKNDANLRLFLLSIGEGRQVLWDESLQDAPEGLWSAAHGLPMWWLIAQVTLAAVLLILSFSRRNGPLRAPLTMPRSSPVEFASSMGDLYEKARATTAATDAARRRLLRAVVREAGVPLAVAEEGPQAIVRALQERLGGEWGIVGAHLEKATQAATESTTLREALAISRALSEDAERIRVAARSGRLRNSIAVGVV